MKKVIIQRQDYTYLEQPLTCIKQQLHYVYVVPLGGAVEGRPAGVC